MTWIHNGLFSWIQNSEIKFGMKKGFSYRAGVSLSLRYGGFQSNQSVLLTQENDFLFMLRFKVAYVQLLISTTWGQPHNYVSVGALSVTSKVILCQFLGMLTKQKTALSKAVQQLLWKHNTIMSEDSAGFQNIQATSSVKSLEYMTLICHNEYA